MMPLADKFPTAEVLNDDNSRFITILPDASGCIVVTYKDNEVSSQYWSPTTISVAVPSDIEIVPLRLFVEFLPGGFRYFKGLDRIREVNEQITLSDLNKELASRLEEVATAGYSIEQIIERMDEILLSQFILQEAQLSRLLPIIKKENSLMSISDMAKACFFSTRHLSRLFHDELGMNAKTYMRLVRINQCLMQMKGREIELTDLSQRLGYCDQAHFNHEFKAICGVTPTKYLSNMSDFYNEPFKF